jgi:OOP family OmpA-OmpF porin
MEDYMKMLPLAAAVAAVVVSGCATSPETIEVGGFKVKPAPPPKQAGAKPGKPGRDNVILKALAQGDTAFDFGSATLKDGGKAELDKLIKIVHAGAGKDKRPTSLGSIIITGHTDQIEANERANADLDEKRAVAVRDYLVSKGVDAKLIFWEGKDSKEPVPVTKFCDVN